jgi:ribose/xylose/arabinose/galactoside ABC-type transport system permease subunit
MLAYFARHGFLYLQHAGHRMPWWEAHCIDVAAGLILGALAGVLGTRMLLRKFVLKSQSGKLKSL